MVLYDFADNSKTQTCAVGFSIAYERIEQRLSNALRNSRALVCDAYFEILAGILGSNCYGAFEPLGGFACVQNQVEKDTLQLS